MNYLIRFGREEATSTVYQQSGVLTIAHVSIQPLDHFHLRMQDTFARFIAVPFEGEQNQATNAPISLDRLVHSLGLNR
jgi:hypothetical protein